MTFKLRSSGPFKMMGASPVKQKAIDPLDLGLLDEAKKVNVNKGLPKNFNTKGSSGAGKTIVSKVDLARASKVKTQNFRDAASKINTVSSKTNVGSRVVNIKPKLHTSSASDRTLHKNLNKIADRYRTPKKTVSKKVVKKTAKKIASRFAGWAGAALTAYDIGKFVTDVGKGMKHRSFDDSVELAWDKNKWWGDKGGNLLKGDDPDPNKIKAIEKIRKAK